MIMTLVNDDERQQSYLLIVLQPDNMDRMRQADPMTVESKSLGGVLPDVQYPDRLAVMVAYEEDEVELWKLGQGGNFGAMLDFLTRGYKFDRAIDGTRHAFKINP